MERKSNKKGMKINNKIVVSNIEINIKQQDKIKYIRTVKKEGKCEVEINNRLITTTKLYHSIRNKFLNLKEVSTKTKIIGYKSQYLATLFYSCDTWVTAEVIQRRIQSAKIKYLRRVANATIMNKV